MEKTQIQIKQKKSNKLILPLAITIAILIAVNIVLVSLAFFTDRESAQSVITFGSVKTESYIMQNGSKLNTITLDSNNLVAGAVTQKDLHIDVIGKSNCYVRLTGEFRIAVDGKNYVNADDLVSFSVDSSATGWKKCDDGKYYYTQVLNGTENGSASQLTLPIKFSVSDKFGNSSMDNTNVYKNKPDKIVVVVESCQSVGTEMGTGNNFDYTKWVNN